MVRVVSCRYMRISCSEDDHPLFRRYYARSNRERGVKLLRCFPHCCPEHVQRCYCGSSIHVLVTFAEDLPAENQDNLIVCARFEPSKVVPLWPSNLPGFDGEKEDNENHRKLQPGEIVSLPVSLLSKGKGQPPTVWIRADREGDVKQKYQNGVMFVLNNHRFPKWLYSYDSSVTRTQREMTHHLVVYVCQVAGTSSQTGKVDAMVLARHESPGFTLVSFRRSGTNGSHAGCDLPAIEMDPSETFSAVAVDSPPPFSSTSDDMDIDFVGQPALTNPTVPKLEIKRSHVFMPQQSHKYQQHQNQQAAKCQGVVRRAETVVSCLGATKQKSSWQQGPVARSCDFREKAKHLLILWHLFRSVLVCDLGLWSNVVGAHVRSHWSRAAACLRIPSLNSRNQLARVMESFLGQVFTRPLASLNSTDPKSSTAQESAITRVTVHLFLRALLSDVVQRRIIFACTIQNDTRGTCISRLQDQFMMLVSDVYDAFDDLLGQVSAQMEYVARGNRAVSIPALVDDVVSLVCAQEHFNELQADVMALLMGEGPRGSLSDSLTCVFQAFTALVREATIASVTANRNATWQRSSVVRTQVEWNQRWLVEPGSVQIADITSNNFRDVLSEMGLANLSQLVYEFGCIDITLGDNGSSLSLQSALSLTGDTAPMTFVLDGKLRVFRVLPTGLPSMIQTAGGWYVGDYKAVLSEGGRLFTLDIFNFAEGVHAGMVQLRWVKLFIQVVKETVSSDATNAHESKDHFAFVHGTVYGSIYSLSSSEIASEFKLSECRVSDRAATWSGATWTPLREVQVGYIAIPRMGGV